MESTAVEVSVVIACKNEERHLGTMLDSLAAQTWDGAWEVVVADNGSTDATRAVAESYRDRLPRLLVVDASEARGYALARNAGVQHASGSKLLFVDGDDAVNERYVGALAGALDEASLVCARIGFDRLNPAWVVAVWPSRWQQDEPLDLFGFLPFAGGGTIGIHRSVFDELGGFRQREVVSQFEEVDLCWRAQLAGHSGPTLVPEAVLEYRLPRRLTALYRRSRSYARGQLALHAVYGSRGMPEPRRTSIRDLAGAVRRTRSRAGLGRAASVLGRLAGQRAGPAGE
jgi:glycosyltransferase involved in cell wall biosynthesis